MIFWRVVQGAAGAPLVPLGQSFLLDGSFPRPARHVISIFGMANMIGPSLGPDVGRPDCREPGMAVGILDDRAGRRRGRAGNILFLPRGRANASARLDWLGFISLSAGIAAAQLVFSRGQRSTGSRAPRSSSRP